MNNTPAVYTVADHITLWVAEGGSIHIKTQEPHGDPVELGEGEAEELIEVLSALLKKIC
jgi:hypothetical protein